MQPPPPTARRAPFGRRGGLLILLVACGGGWPKGDAIPLPPAATEAGTITGQVLGPDGAPLPGAHLTTEPRGIEATADADGRFTLGRLLPGDYTVWAAAPGLLAAAQGPLTITEAAGADLRFTLAAPPALDGQLTVTVWSPYDAPAAGISVVATDGDLVVEGTTDETGQVTLIGLAGHTVALTVADPTGRWAGRSSPALAVPTAGNTSASFALSGHSDPDFVGTSGTRICSMCHADVAATYVASAHARSMSALEGGLAPAFDAHTTLDLDGATATLTRSGGAPIVILEDSAGQTQTWPVSGLLGDEARGAVPWTEAGGHAWPLPLAFRPTDNPHAELDLGGWVPGDRDLWFNPDGSFAAADTPPIEATAEARCFGCHASGFVLAPDEAGGLTMTAATADTGRWDEAAVSCERCHGPGLSHSAGPLDEKVDHILNPTRIDPDLANAVCAQCHSGLAGEAHSAYPWTADGGLFAAGEDLSDYASEAFEPWSEAGYAAAPNQSANELARSAHATDGWTARCTDCHDPHGGENRAATVLPVDDNALCDSCHIGLSFGGDAAVSAAHTGHPVYAPSITLGPGRCTGCHMPQTSSQLGWTNPSAAGDTASHRFLAVPPKDSLTAFDAAGEEQLPAGTFAPNACQDCHAWGAYKLGVGFRGPAGDMTLRSTHAALQEGYEALFP